MCVCFNVRGERGGDCFFLAGWARFLEGWLYGLLKRRIFWGTNFDLIVLLKCVLENDINLKKRLGGLEILFTR